ncbi:MAG TPA: LptF/LptG family permease, partial [Nitrospirae bacterium]|nr:LptF/LptG family permease [Nitrospirota bacterium]
YLLLQTPRVILFALPFASLFSILMTLGMASKWKETITIRASGGSTKRVFSFFLVLGLIISLAALFLGETIVPAATKKASWVRQVKILKRSPKIAYRKEALWLKGRESSLIRISGFVEDGNRILKTSIFTFTPSFSLEKRIEAESAEWAGNAWELKNVKVFDIGNNITKNYSSLMTNLIEEPKIFREEMKQPDEMNFFELQTYYSRLQKAGFKNVKYLVRLYEKLAYPAINFVMILFGIALALNSNWGGGMRAVGLGVIISIVYWLSYSITISLGTTGILQPWLASWASPIVFGIAGGIMYSKINE